MKRLVIWATCRLFVTLLPIHVFAQDPHWEYVDFPYSFSNSYFNTFSINMLKGYEDVETDKVYLYDYFFTGAPPFGNCSINLSRYDGENYETIGHFGSEILKVLKFQGDIYAGGFFQCVDSDNTIKYVARYDGDFWHSVGEINGSVTDMVIDGSYLYVSGFFTQIDGVEVNGIARFDGANWEPLPAGGFDSGSSIKTLCIYQGELYVGGRLDILGEPDSDIGLRVMRNGQWEAVNNDQYIENTTINDLVVYNDKLYILGDFFFGGYSIHTGILVWDGESITAPYPDFYDVYGQIGYGSVPYILQATSDYLYAAGPFEYIGDQQVNRLAAYNGDHWCSMFTSGLEDAIYAMFTFRDTVYAYLYLNPYSGTLYPSGLYKWIGGDDFENCTPTGISKLQPDQIQVVPNPVQDYCTVQCTFTGNTKYSLYDNSGRLIINEATGNADNFQVDMRYVSNGLYLLKIENGKHVYTAKIQKL